MPAAPVTLNFQSLAEAQAFFDPEQESEASAAPEAATPEAPEAAATPEAEAPEAPEVEATPAPTPPGFLSRLFGGSQNTDPSAETEETGETGETVDDLRAENADLRAENAGLLLILSQVGTAFQAIPQQVAERTVANGTASAADLPAADSDLDTADDGAEQEPDALAAYEAITDDAERLAHFEANKDAIFAAAEARRLQAAVDSLS